MSANVPSTKRSTKFTSNPSTTDPCLRWTSNVIWALAILAMTGLAIRDMYPLFRDYFDENANLAVQMDVKRNDTIDPAPLFFCMPQPQGQIDEIMTAVQSYIYHSGDTQAFTYCEACEPLVSQNWDVWNQKNYENSSNPILNMSVDPFPIRNKELLSLQLVTAFVQKLMANRIDEILSLSNAYWNRAVLEAVCTLFTYLSQYSGDVEIDNTIESIRKTKTRDEIDDLFDKTVELICNMMQLGIYERDAVVPLPLSECPVMVKPSATFIRNNGTRYFCFKLPTHLGKVGIYITEFFVRSVAKSKPFYVLPELPKPNASTPMVGLHTSKPFDRVNPKSEQVTISYGVQTSMIEKSRKCFQGNVEDCSAACALKEYCSCQPFILRSTGTNYTGDYCDPDGYATCTEYLEAAENISSPFGQKCRKQCDILCEFTSYQFIVTPILDNLRPYVDTPKFALMVNPAPSPFLEFTADVKDTREDMISKVGGSLNFYLTLSGFSVITAITFAIGYCGRLRLKERRGAAKNSTMKSTGRIEASVSGENHHQLQILRHEIGDLSLAQATTQNGIRSVIAEMEALKKRSNS